MAHADQVLVYRVRSVDRMAASSLSVLFVARVSSVADGLNALRNQLPDGWDAELTEYRLTQETIDRLALAPGEVRSFTGPNRPFSS